MHPALRQTSHRPWPLPDRKWKVSMRWHDLLFAHWPVRPEVLRPFLPAPLAIDTYDGWAWLGVVPFRMTGVRPRGIPRVLGHSLNELNVRTYVRGKGRTGVWFFSLDASSPLAVRLARRWYCLPYFDADIQHENVGESIRYESIRTGSKAAPARFRGEYKPVGPASEAPAGSLDHFLTERYALFALDRRGRVLLADIHHPPWALQPAEAEIARNTTTQPMGVHLPARQPVLHYAREQHVVAWAPRRLRDMSTPETSPPLQQLPFRRAGWRRILERPVTPLADG